MTRRSLLLLLLIGTLLAACAPGGAGQPTPDINGTIQANAQTMVAAINQTQTALAPAATNTALPTATGPATSTPLSLPTSGTVFVPQPVYIAASATPTGPTPTPLASSLGVGCKNLELLASWTEPDSPLNPGQQFTQVWRVRNNGTCDWMFVFEVVFVSGDKLGEATSQGFDDKEPPGSPTDWRQIRVGMRAPNNSGTYKASWRMTDGNTPFGAVLPVTITVGGPTKTPKPDTAGTSAAQTVAAGVQQTAAAQAQQTAIQAAILTAVAQTQTQAAIDATATSCTLTQTAGGTCP